MPQNVRLLRSLAVPQAGADSYAYPQSSCAPDHSLMEEEVGTPKVSAGCFISSSHCRTESFNTYVWAFLLRAVLSYVAKDNMELLSAHSSVK